MWIHFEEEWVNFLNHSNFALDSLLSCMIVHTIFIYFYSWRNFIWHAFLQLLYFVIDFTY